MRAATSSVYEGARRDTPVIVCLVQARMSSRRFPGKVLAPFRGEPLIRWVVDAVHRVEGVSAVVVATSDQPSDEPLVAYLEQLGVEVFRGPLDDVFGRFRGYATRSSCEWMLRVSADSPLLSPAILDRLVTHPERDRSDLVTTIFPRSYPRGRNGELIRRSTFLAIDPGELTDKEREHVTLFYYTHPERFRIVNVRSEDPRAAETSLAVDTVEDLVRLERLSDQELSALPA